MRNISYSMTTLQFKNGTKDVIRRMGWLFLKTGDMLQAWRTRRADAMTFWVGQKVVCVDAVYNDPRCAPCNDLVEGGVYTVSGFGTHVFHPGVIAVHLEEIPRAYNEGLNPRRFRPVVESKTEVRFTIGADPSTDQFDNRRKVRKKVTT